MHAPVLIVPRIFEPELCRQLIAHCHETGGRPSGVMRTLNGKTVAVLDVFKRRKDATRMIADTLRGPWRRTRMPGGILIRLHRAPPNGARR